MDTRKTQEEKRSRDEQSRDSDYQKRMWEWFRRYSQEASCDNSYKTHHRHPLQAEYDLLGCAPDSSDEIVKSAYRKTAKACHPDLLRARGLSESQIALATSKMAKINAAWEKIRKERGM